MSSIYWLNDVFDKTYPRSEIVAALDSESCVGDVVGRLKPKHFAHYRQFSGEGLLRYVDSHAANAALVADLKASCRLERSLNHLLVPFRAYKVAHLLANPLGLKGPRVEIKDELDAMREANGDPEARHLLEIDSIEATSVDDLVRKLTRGEHDILHISSHGDLANLVLQSLDGKAEMVDKPALVRFILDVVRADAKLTLVVVNACYSLDGTGPAAKAVNLITCSGPVENKAAIRFSRTFYTSLAKGDSIGAAFGLGRNAAELIRDEAFHPEFLAKDSHV